MSHLGAPRSTLPKENIIVKYYYSGAQVNSHIALNYESRLLMEQLEEKVDHSFEQPVDNSCVSLLFILSDYVLT